MVKIFFYDSTFEENRRLLFPKIFKYITRNFDDYIFKKKHINTNSLGMLLNTELFNNKRL